MSCTAHLVTYISEGEAAYGTLQYMTHLHLFQGVLDCFSLPLEGLPQGLLVGSDNHFEAWLVIFLKRCHVLLALCCMCLQHSEVSSAVTCCIDVSTMICQLQMSILLMLYKVRPCIASWLHVCSSQACYAGTEVVSCLTYTAHEELTDPCLQSGDSS